MCLLIIAEKEFPSYDILRAAEESNPHGGGIAWIEGSKVRWKKNIKVDEIIQYEKKGPPWLIHFRISTIGGPVPELCHPFPISMSATTDLEGEANSVLAHNGHWSEWQKIVLNTIGHDTPLPPGPWSDTRAMAWLSANYGKGILDLIDEKVAVLNSNYKIQRYGKGWHTENNTHYSYNIKTRVWKGINSQQIGAWGHGFCGA